MTALTAPTPLSSQLGGTGVLNEFFDIPAKKNTVFYSGGLIAIDSSGYAVKATTSGVMIRGIAYQDLDTTLDSNDGDHHLRVRRGVINFANSSSTNQITKADCGNLCYVVDDATVAKTDSNGTRPVAGIIQEVDASGRVFVQIQGIPVGSAGAGQSESSVSVFVNLASLANSGVISTKMNKAGRVKSIEFITGAPATTGSKAATLTGYTARAATPNTHVAFTAGGVLALTSANQATAGGNNQCSAITGTNEFQAGDYVGVDVSGVTAFAEGSGTLVFHFC